MNFVGCLGGEMVAEKGLPLILVIGFRQGQRLFRNDSMSPIEQDIVGACEREGGGPAAELTQSCFRFTGADGTRSDFVKAIINYPAT